MGAIVGDENKALTEIQAMSNEARGHIAHHMRNTAQTLISAIHTKDENMAKEAIRHMIEDLERMGC